MGRAALGRWYLAKNDGQRFVDSLWGTWNPLAAWPEVPQGDYPGDGLLDVAGRTSSGPWYASENTAEGFVNRLWQSSLAPGDETGTAASDGGLHDHARLPIRWSVSSRGWRVWKAVRWRVICSERPNRPRQGGELATGSSGKRPAPAWLPAEGMPASSAVLARWRACCASEGRTNGL